MVMLRALARAIRAGFLCPTDPLVLQNTATNPFAMLIPFDRDSLHIDSRRRGVPVPERILSLNDRAGLLRHHPRISMPRLVDVDILQADLPAVQL